MAKKRFGCERPECCASTDICDRATFGTGKLDFYGYWQFPCKKCENAWKEYIQGEKFKVKGEQEQ